MNYVFHIDINSAFLSIEAAHQLYNGAKVDIRNIPSIIGGNQDSRHGIVLAKSIPCKAYGIKTGESVLEAKQKCPTLKIYPPNYSLYMKASNAMMELIREYSPYVQQFSIDECFVLISLTGSKYTNPIDIANEIKERIYNELGFTVNIGLSYDRKKILAKMASDFEKPNKVHTLFPEEIESKLWPLPVGDLFMVGEKTKNKLLNLGIYTIGELANAPPELLNSHFKSHGYLIQAYANGLDESPVKPDRKRIVKGMGNNTTIHFDVLDAKTAYIVLLSLCETVGMRLRAALMCAGLIAIHITYADFRTKSHQRKLSVAMNSTTYIHNITKELFDVLWDGQPIRKLGVRVNDLHSDEYVQLSILESFDFETNSKIDNAVDSIRRKYGTNAIHRASFLHSGLSPTTGGAGQESYPVMSTIL